MKLWPKESKLNQTVRFMGIPAHVTAFWWPPVEVKELGLVWLILQTAVQAVDLI